MVQIIPFDPSLIDLKKISVWRYLKLFGLNFEDPKVVRGTGRTPLLPLGLEGRNILVKSEYFSPTVSFKDRGTEVMINILSNQKATQIAEDSSGDAGASVAAYAARAGIKAKNFVPAHASPSKHRFPFMVPRSSQYQAIG